jgi:hypothetical protein
MANQNGKKPSEGGGTRYIFYCCSECNGQKKGQSNNMRKNAIHHAMSDCDCGHMPGEEQGGEHCIIM